MIVMYSDDPGNPKTLVLTQELSAPRVARMEDMPRWVGSRSIPRSSSLMLLPHRSFALSYRREFRTLRRGPRRRLLTAAAWGCGIGGMEIDEDKVDDAVLARCSA